MRKLVVRYFSGGPWSSLIFDRLLKDPELKKAFIVPRTDSEDLTLLRYSEQYGIPCLKGIMINSHEFIEMAEKFAWDLFVSLSFSRIFEPKIANMPPLGTINCHVGELPLSRRRNTLSWGLINYDKEFRITVHFIDNGKDTGDIILQRCLPISDSDNCRSLLEAAQTECARLLNKAIRIVRMGNYDRVVRTTVHSLGLYRGIRGYGEEIKDRGLIIRKPFNFIRAVFASGPVARTTVGSSPLEVGHAYLINSAPNYQGTFRKVESLTDRQYVVRTTDTTIVDTHNGVRGKNQIR